MFGRLKNLFKKHAPEEQAVEPAAESFAPREFRPGYKPGAPIPPPPPSEEETPEVSEESPVEAPPVPSATGDVLQLSLRSILLKLPDPLKSRVRQPPGANVQISIPIQKVLPQLAHGSVKITFGELRQASPAGVFLESGDQDQTSVELPLSTVLSQLKGGLLTRRADQRRVDVPDEVSSLFGSKGEPLATVRMSTTASPPASAAPPPTPAVVQGHAPAVPIKPVAMPLPTAPIRPTAPLPQAPVKPTVPIKPTTPLPAAPIKPSAPLPAPASLRPQTPPAPAAPVVPTAPLPTTQPVIRPTLPSSLPPAAAPRPAAPQAPAPVARVTPAPPVAPVSPVTPGEPLVVPLASVSGAWPEAVRQELGSVPDASLSLPAEEVEQALKRGKITFQWKRLRSWIKPPPTAGVSAQDEAQLELPLAVVAPLFLAHRKPGAAQRKYAITEDIPDVFSGRGMAPVAPVAPVPAPPPSAAPLPAAAPAIAMPRPAVQPAPVAAPAAARPVPQEIGEVFGQPGRKNWTPSEIVEKVSSLRGVAGALIAMQDGLLVASHLPPGLNGETIAAFLPQMFTRVMQYSKELKFTEASSLTLIVEDVPLKIFKAGGVYFTVLGRAEEPLPGPQLSVVAAQFGPQNK